MAFASVHRSFRCAGVSAQPYCAFYSDGTTACGIPTLQICDASISGVGGYCGPDQTSQIPPNFIQRLERNNLPPPRLQPNSRNPDSPAA